ncbi:MAG: DUF4943 family protein [Planctomycetota bacterium]|jgi:hypothetical protein
MRRHAPTIALAIALTDILISVALAGTPRTTDTTIGASRSEPLRAKQIYGVHCRLRANRYKWRASEIPKFKAYIPGRGNDDLWLATVIDRRFRIQVDGQWYSYVGPEWIGGVGSHSQTEWIAKAGGYLPVLLDKHSWKGVRDHKPLDLSPGEHRISLGWAGYKAEPPSPSGREEDENPILLVSEPVRIQVLDSSATAAETTAGDERHRQVMELFRTYVQKEPVTEAEEKLGIRTDVKSFHYWKPAFTWNDIPVLLELAESDRLMNWMPKLVASSYIGRRCREGMIALWFVEGLRRAQVSEVRQEQLGEKQHPAQSRLPLNPICRKEGMNLSECESSAEIHEATLRAYQAWWRAVGALPARHAAVFYPLDLTDLKWFGGGERWRDQPLRVYSEASADRTVAERTVRQWKYVDSDYKPQKVLQTIYYTPKDSSAKAPFTRDMLVVQKVLLYFYNEEGEEIGMRSIVPLPPRP